MDELPIWLSNWTIEYIGGKGASVQFTIKEVVVKGFSEQEIMSNSDCLRRVVHILLDRKKKVDDTLLAKYVPVKIELIKQIGFGINDQ